MFKTKWRVVPDRCLGYEVQRKVWWWPFWFQDGINTYSTLKKAIAHIKRKKQTTVYYQE